MHARAHTHTQSTYMLVYKAAALQHYWVDVLRWLNAFSFDPFFWLPCTHLAQKTLISFSGHIQFVQSVFDV